ncbi:MAG TPA: hypothetical protein VEN78_26360, partial [Bradyrhizobium sp.]|nr:hypothetical protein [Bradyrhizobium sp.]
AAIAGGASSCVFPIQFSSSHDGSAGEPSSRECAPDDRLREAIHLSFCCGHGLLRHFAPRNDGLAV